MAGNGNGKLVSSFRNIGIICGAVGALFAVLKPLYSVAASAIAITQAASEVPSIKQQNNAMVLYLKANNDEMIQMRKERQVFATKINKRVNNIENSQAQIQRTLKRVFHNLPKRKGGLL